MLDSNDSVYLTTEEIAVLCASLELELPPPLNDVWSTLTETHRDAAMAMATTTLVERTILSGENGQEVHEAIGLLMASFAAPGLVAVAAMEFSDGVDSRAYAVDDNLAVEHETMSPSIHRLRAFPPRDLVAQIQLFLDLRPAPLPDTEPFEARIADLDASADKVEAHETETAIAVLTEAGVGVEPASEFVDALRTRRATNVVSVVYRPDDEQVAGGQITWIDTGTGGLWKVEPVAGSSDGGEVCAEVSPTSADEIMQEMMSFLPQLAGEAE